VAHKEKGRFDEEKLSVLKSLSSQLGVVFELGGLLEELQGKLEELGRERDFSRALVDAMPSALALLDEKGNVVFVNRRFAELLGYGYREVEGKPFTSLLARGEKRRVGRAVMVRRPGESRWTEASIVTHAGTKPFLVISTPRPYEGGEYRGAIVILNDLSRQWSVERRVSRMEEEARRLDRELSGARRTLRKLDARSKAYLSMVHHEIAGPIRMLRRRLEEMERGSDGGAGEELKEDLDWLLAEVARLERLTSDIKDIGALEKGRLRLRRSKTDLGELVSRAAEEVKTGKRRSGVKLRLHLPGETLVARVDRSRMAQVIAGVLDNAVEFSPEEGTVDLRLVRREGTALLEIKDMGPGMEPGLLRSLHELMEGEGPAEGLRTGLSLYLCHHVVRAHGGEFRLESEPGKGTRVRITLPLAAEEEGG
jgi:PAS domain S-box-containing protein